VDEIPTLIIFRAKIMPDIMEEIRGFKYGVQAGAEHDETPSDSTPYAWNTALRSIGGGLATLGTRPGLKIVNTSVLTGSPAFHLIRNYPYISSGITNKLALVTQTGRLYFKDDTNTIGSEITPPANFPYTSGRCFASGDFAVDATIMDNRLFMVNTNSERRSVLNETFKMFGLDHLGTIATSNQAGGSSGMPAETYDVVTTTYDDATGAESSSSATQSVTLAANERIRIIVTPSASETARYPYWRVYIRRQTTQSTLFRVLTLEDSGGANITTTGNIPIATTTAYVDLSATQISQLLLPAPTESENNEPPSSARYLATFGGRMIMADLRSIYWSKLGQPDAFPPTNTESLDTGEGDELRGLHEFSDDLMLVFTADNLWGIFGNDPQNWTIKAIDHNVGCASRNSVVEVPGGLVWWSATQGPVMFNGTEVIKLGLDKLGPEIVINNVEGSRLQHIVSGYDPQGQRALFGYSLLNTSSRNDAIIPFNSRVQEFEATRWNPMDFSAYGLGYDSDDKVKLFCGNYGGQIFILDADTLNDGAPSGTVHGTFTPAASSISTITTTDLYTTGAGLAERYIVIKNANGNIVGRERIASNTATVITLAANITSLTAGEVHTFDIAGADIRLHTKWLDFKQAFLRKRVDNVYIHIRTSTDSEDLLMGTAINFNDTVGTIYEGWALDGATWDAEDALWDASNWGGSGEAKKRFRVIRNCNAVKVALFHSRANKDIVFLKIAAMGRSLSDRYYG
jgi:hypothetical protein